MAKAQGNKKGTRGGAPSKRAVAGAHAQSKPSYQRGASGAAGSPLLDERTKLDIIGVVLAVVAIALFVCVAVKPEGVLSQVIANGLGLLLGWGAYLLPFLLLGLSATVLVRSSSERLTARTGLGLGILLVALLSLFSLFVPGAEGEPYLVFTPENLVNHGGYVGAGIAWVLLNLLGLTISVILMLGLSLIALIVIGFSLSGLISNLRSIPAARRAAREAGEPQQNSAPLPRVLRGKSQANANAEAKTELLGQGASELVQDELDPSHLVTRKLSSKKKDSADAGKTQLLPPHPLPIEDEVDTAAAESRMLTRKLPKRKASLVPVAKDDAEPEPEASSPKPEEPKKKPKIAVAAPQRQEGFELPDPAFLNVSKPSKQSRKMAETLAQTAENLGETLAEFGINATVVDWVAGPTVTLFKIDLPAGVRVSRVTALTDDIALALASPGVRIFAPVPGTNYVGIEVPNREHQTVLLGDVLKSAKPGPLQVAIGKDVEGNSIVSDLAKMPHLLIGGTTGSGKSVAINGMIMSILMRATPAEVRLIMIDPKRVEFTPYNGIPHLYVPVVTECKEAASALAWAVAEMERRLKEFSKMGVRNIGQYNAKIFKQNEEAENEEDKREQEPYIVVIIDELADLMMNVGKEVEFSIARLAQLARAAGIHLIVATQRPSTNVVTGLIKANITNRMAFNVASGIDSRVILDQTGAENLIGQGDLLLSKPEYAKPVRIQGCFVSEDEIESVVEHLKTQGEPDYHTDILKTNVIHMGDTNPDGSGGVSGGPADPLLWDAAEIVCSSGMGSTSNLQRRLSVGYARAGRIMDLLEEKGIVGPANGSRPREVLLDPLDLEGLKALEMNDE